LSIVDYLTTEDVDAIEDVYEVVRYREHPAFDAVPFIGSIKKHPYDREKILVLLVQAQKICRGSKKERYLK